MTDAGQGAGDSGRDEPPLGQQAPCETGAGCVSGGGIFFLVVTFLLMALALIYSLVALWPAVTPATDGGTATVQASSTLFGQTVTLGEDARFFVVVALAGALGAMLHAVRSLSWYVGNRHLTKSWVPFYFLLPVVGAAAATLVYLVLRGGLFASTVDTSATNAYGVAAIGALIGLFTEQTMAKLNDVFSTLMAAAPQGRDSRPAGRPASPPEAATGEPRDLSGGEVTLTATVKPNGGITNARFAYGESTAYGTRTETISIPADEKERALEARVKDLTPGTTYHFRVEAGSPSGEVMGEDREFTAA